jgi:aryl-alcohol dehydrogenase-like predicted oxidoreductase
MRYRSFGRKEWQVSEIGYGMWGMGSWAGSVDSESIESLQRAVDLGCNFFDTAEAYGEGRSERLLGELVRNNTGRRLFTATKIPPKNRLFPARREFTVDDCFPPDHVDKYVNISLKNAGLDRFDLIQLHTWEDHWMDDDRLLRKIEELRTSKVCGAVGISLNRWEPENGIRAVRSGIIDSVQVIYNIFDQNPEDELFPACREMNVAIIARVPFDEGSLTGTLTLDSRWPEEDWRNTYFEPENLRESVKRADQLKKISDMPLSELALRFILSNPLVSTTIPGMRKIGHVEQNIGCSDKGRLEDQLLGKLRSHRWVRRPTNWSQ